MLAAQALRNDQSRRTGWRCRHTSWESQDVFSPYYASLLSATGVCGIVSPDLTRHFKSVTPVWGQIRHFENQLPQLPDEGQDAGEPGSTGHDTEDCVETPSHCCRFRDCADAEVIISITKVRQLHHNHSSEQAVLARSPVFR
jgi:hypothetical protein